METLLLYILKIFPFHIFKTLTVCFGLGFIELIGRHSKYEKHNDVILNSDYPGYE
jgi:hypothetical protein